MKKIIFNFLLILPVLSYSQNSDIDLLKSINHNRSSFATSSFSIASNSAYIIPFAYPVVMFTIGEAKKNKPVLRESFFSSASIATSLLLSYSSKLIIKRPRPYDAYPNQLIIDKPSNTYSFPSGHTTAAFCTATSMTLYYKKWYVALPAYAWAGSVAYSRMYLGKHYPTDVLGGMILGTGIPLLIHFCPPVNHFVDRIGKGLLKY